MDDYNPFIKDELFPEPYELFGFCPKPLGKIKETSQIVLDTNTLLLPYLVGSHSIEAIKTVYRKLVSEERLCVPGQVAREFAQNRPTKILELIRGWHNVVSTIPSMKSIEFHMLEGHEDYKQCQELQKEFESWRKKYRDSVQKVERTIKSWYLNDPISMIYRDLFSNGVVLDLELDQDAVKKELERRNQHNIPPGYMDKKKPDGGIGDFLIWKTILSFARMKKDVIFVSSDETKGDWVYFQDEQRLHPRHELIDEFRRASGGGTLHIIKLADLLELFESAPDTVKEVRREEKRQVVTGVSTEEETYYINIYVKFLDMLKSVAGLLESIIGETEVILMNSKLMKGLQHHKQELLRNFDMLKIANSDALSFIFSRIGGTTPPEFRIPEEELGPVLMMISKYIASNDLSSGNSALLSKKKLDVFYEESKTVWHKLGEFIEILRWRIIKMRTY